MDCKLVRRHDLIPLTPPTRRENALLNFWRQPGVSHPFLQTRHPLAPPGLRHVHHRVMPRLFRLGNRGPVYAFVGVAVFTLLLAVGTGAVCDGLRDLAFSGRN